jgi:hypothetical protein
MCGAAGMLVAGYGNNIFFMYPNYILVYGGLTLVYMAPHYDRALQEEKALADAPTKEKAPEIIPSFQVESFKQVFAND